MPEIRIHRVSVYWATMGLETQLWIRICCRIGPAERGARRNQRAERSARREDGPTCLPAQTRLLVPAGEAAAAEPPPPPPLFPIHARSSRRPAAVSPPPPLVLHPREEERLGGREGCMALRARPATSCSSATPGTSGKTGCQRELPAVGEKGPPPRAARG